ncbi:MAG: hypothetical protein FJ125_07540 [Deltaproteobacteria bacterium]|nr:hypothetical protein [Deltaproteobacteria bacterium]
MQRHVNGTKAPAGILLPLLAMVLVAFLSGCPTSDGDDREPEAQPPGSLQIHWRITELSKSCEQAEVKKIQLRLELVGEVVHEETKECSDTDRTATMGNIAPATYDLVISGLDGSGKAIYRARTNVNIRPGSTEVLSTPLTLSRLPALLKINWSFANGMRCGYNKVHRIEIVIWDVEDEEAIDDRMSYDCDFEGDFVTIEVKRPGTVKVIASGIDETGRAIFADSQQFDLVAEQVQEVLLRLQTCAPGMAGC